MSDERTTPRHILVPVDFSETANHALDFALDLAEALGARVTLMHAYDIVSSIYPEGLILTTEMASQIQEAASQALEAAAGRARRPGVELTTVLRAGPPWGEVVALAAESSADLIVMGTHGRRGLKRLLLGSVAERVVRTAPCPVLTVPPWSK